MASFVVYIQILYGVVAPYMEGGIGNAREGDLLSMDEVRRTLNLKYIATAFIYLNRYAEQTIPSELIEE